MQPCSQCSSSSLTNLNKKGALSALHQAVQNERLDIPVLESPLELDFAKSTSIGVKWRGLEPEQAEHIVGYVLEYKSEDDDEWQEHNGVVRHRQRQNEYKSVVRGLQESTEYFFRLRVVGKGDKRGGPGPELKAMTKCGSKNTFRSFCTTLIRP